MTKNILWLAIAPMLGLFSLAQGQEWIVQESGTDVHLTGVSFVDSSTGWIVGQYGTLLHTDDGGENWSPQESGTEFGLGDVEFVNQDSGWAVGQWNLILFTSDGGITWTPQTDSGSGGFAAVDFVDSHCGWAVGAQDIEDISSEPWVVRTTNSGTTWTTAYYHNVEASWYGDVSFSDRNNGWAVSSPEGTLHTTDGGQHWESDFMAARYGVKTIDSLHCWTVGFGPEAEGLWETTDGGLSWIHRDGSGRWTNIDFGGTQSGVAVGSFVDHTLHTSDGGMTWFAVPIDSSLQLNGLSVVDNDHAWIVTRFGVILSLNSSTSVGDGTPAGLSPQTYELFFYPNPFNSSTRLSYDIPDNTHINLSVYDLNGRLIRTLEDRVIPAGAHALNFDATNLPSGMYFVRLNTASFATTQKLLLLK